MRIFMNAGSPLRVAAVITACTLASCSDAISPRGPAKLVFLVQPPSSVVSGGRIQPDIRIAIQDENGNTITSATDEIVLGLGGGPAEGRLAGPSASRAVAGVASFTGLFINKAGTGYTLSATAEGMSGALSTPFEVRAGTGVSLAFVTQPATVVVAGNAMPAVSVAVQDASGNTDATATNRITLIVVAGSNGTGPALDSAIANAENGVATFSGFRIKQAGSSYRLLARSSGTSQALSQTFSIAPGPPKQIAFLSQPGSVPIGDAINSFSLELRDAFGNRSTAATNTVTLSFGTNPSGAVLSGVTTTAAISGTATFNGVKVDKIGTNYTLVAASPDLEPATSTPFSIRNTLLATSIGAGYFHSCAVEPGGAAYCWGDNASGQLGNPVAQGSTTPVNVGGQIGLTKVASGRDHNCGLDGSGVMYCWGTNANGQLGNAGGQSTLPRAVAGGLVFADLTAGYEHTCGVTTSGAGYCWGSGLAGELGNEATINSAEPRRVSGDLVFRSIGAGRLFTCGVTTDAKAYCWGQNESGQLGNGSNANSSRPVAVAGNLTFAAVSAGGFHSCGLTTTGAVYCWGSNSFGQLGNGSTAFSAAPVPVAGDRVFVSLTVGNRHTCAITASGDAYCWGDNSSLALGTGSAGSISTVPALVAGSHPFAILSAGRFHTCGLTMNDEVYCWGNNASGALGTGTQSNASQPQRVR